MNSVIGEAIEYTTYLSQRSGVARRPRGKEKGGELTDLFGSIITPPCLTVHMRKTVDWKTDVKINNCKCTPIEACDFCHYNNMYYGVGICRNCGQWACRCQ